VSVPGRPPAGADPLGRRWPWLVRWFQAYGRRYVGRHFHAVRLARQGSTPRLPDGPLIVALNHPSWWDPMMGVVLSPLLGRRVHVVPIEGRALQRYRFFERLGFFGIEPGTRAGYDRLLEVADRVMERPDVAFWITPQGRFTDIRTRPPALRPGIGLVARRVRRGAILPVALEYGFWSERLPEALIRLGDPILVEDGTALEAEVWTARVERGLAATQDALAHDAIRRDPDAFRTLVEGRIGVGWIYDAWRRLGALLGGTRFDAAHGSGAGGSAEETG
jgi:1-acyl-sn-glycerol-3-phosphate acyltransferase